jgi:ring-1,2-phenylacetyl-CoA epoxidase subunit PaaB
MSDTQWPRFEVFHQEAPDQPHRHAGSVHAPDSEMALLNARDVFVRRPECSSLWVAPAVAIFGGTAEQLAETANAPAAPPGEPAEYLVFAKLDRRGTLSHIGQVVASSTNEAVELGVRFCAPDAPRVLWVVPAGKVARSEPDQASSFFGPARDKPYRDQAYYRVQSALRRLRREAGG